MLHTVETILALTQKVMSAVLLVSFLDDTANMIGKETEWHF